MRTLSARDGSVTAELMRKWDLAGTLAKPPNANGILTKMTYIRQYAIRNSTWRQRNNDKSLNNAYTECYK